MKAVIIIFPGTNREIDAKDALEIVGVKKIDFVWHKDRQFDDRPDLILIPGGFSWGDYLRAGAIAAKSDIMQEIINHAKGGTRIIGICNGFQILCEAGLLPGLLMRNKNLHFIAREVDLQVNQTNHPLTQYYQKNQTVCYPVAHHDGNYFASNEILKNLEDNEQILFRYGAAKGVPDEMDNINGSQHHIAGICNEAGNVVGMMPHPENAIRPYHVSQDGLKLFQGLCHG